VAERRKGSAARTERSPLRQMILAHHRARFGPGSRWATTHAPTDYELALANGDPVVVDSGAIFSALSHAGQPVDEFAFGGPHFGKWFLISADDVVTEYVEDQDAEHCPGPRKCGACQGHLERARAPSSPILTRIPRR
jgi:hypothetical protein